MCLVGKNERQVNLLHNSSQEICLFYFHPVSQTKPLSLPRSTCMHTLCGDLAYITATRNVLTLTEFTSKHETHKLSGQGFNHVRRKKTHGRWRKVAFTLARQSFTLHPFFLFMHECPSIQHILCPGKCSTNNIKRPGQARPDHKQQGIATTRFMTHQPTNL